MKKFLVIAVVCLLAACTTAQQQKASALLTQAKQQIANACAVVQPTLGNVQAAYPNDLVIKQVVADNGAFCSGVSSVDQTNAQTIISTTIPKIIGAVALLPIDPAQKVTIQIALGAASVALSNFLVVYGQQASAPVGASS